MSAAEPRQIDTSAVADESTLRVFLDDLESLLEEISVEYSLCWWDKYTGGPECDVDAVEAKRAQVLLNREYADVISAWRGKPTDGLVDRRLTVLSRWFEDASISCAKEVYSLRNSVNDRIVAFRPKVGGREVSFAERGDIIRKEPDRATRKDAYLSMLPLDKAVRADLIELMGRRNEKARAIGRATYVEHALAQSGIDRGMLLGLFDELEALTAEDYTEILERSAEELGVPKIEPWDLSFAVEQAVSLPDEYFPKDGIVPKVRRLFASFGLDLDDLGIELVVRDIPFGGLCFGIKVPDDIRILANPQDGHRFYEILFHEFGHAVHDKLIDQNSPVLRYGVEGCFHEGTAELLGGVASERDWLSKETDTPAEMIEAYTSRKRQATLVRLRRLMACASFEYAAYADLSQDLDSLWRSTTNRYLGMDEQNETIWASLSLFTTHPVYFQNYVLAEAIAAQTAEYLKTNLGGLMGNARAIDFLRTNYYAPGASLDWTEKVEAATEKPLSASALARRLGH
jgi:oligoendopeptidase F